MRQYEIRTVDKFGGSQQQAIGVGNSGMEAAENAVECGSLYLQPNQPIYVVAISQAGVSVKFEMARAS